MDIALESLLVALAAFLIAGVWSFAHRYWKAALVHLVLLLAAGTFLLTQLG